jgi:hypothetical protein
VYAVIVTKTKLYFDATGSDSDLRQPFCYKLPAPCSQLSFSASQSENVTIVAAPPELTTADQKAIDDSGEAADKADD